MITLFLVFIITLRVFGGQNLNFNATNNGLALRVYSFMFNPYRAFLKEREKGKEKKKPHPFMAQPDILLLLNIFGSICWLSSTVKVKHFSSF